MRRTGKVFRILGGALLLLLLVVVGGLMTAPHWLPPLLPRLTGDQVQISGLAGRLPDRMQVAQITIGDARGVWLTLDDVSLDWSPLALLRRQIRIRDLSASAITLVRLPAESAAPSGTGAPETEPPGLPSLRLALDRLHIGTLSLPESLAGHAARLAIDGAVAVETLTNGQADLIVQRQDSAGRYSLQARLAESGPELTAVLDEPAEGLLSGLAHLPLLGAVHVTATVTGPPDGSHVTLSAAAGPLTATANGVVNLSGQTITALDLALQAPAMTPEPEISWQSAAIAAHVSGPFATPDVSGRVTLVGLKAYGAAFNSLESAVSGRGGQIAVTSTVTGLMVPGPSPALFAAAPVTVKADLSPQGTADFTLLHPLLHLEGQVVSGPATHLTVHTTVPELAPFALIGGLSLSGRAMLDLDATRQDDRHASLTLNGTVGIGQGPAPLPGLIGDAATITAAATQTGDSLALTALTIKGRTLTVSASGGEDGNKADLAWNLALSDLHVLADRLAGTLEARGNVGGPLTRLNATAEVTARLGLDKAPPTPVSLQASFDDILAAPTGSVTAKGVLAGAPLALDTEIARDAGGTTHVVIRKAGWKSLQAQGTASLVPGALFPMGELHLGIGTLDDLSPWIGQPVSGSLQVVLRTTTDRGRPASTVETTLRDLRMAGAQIANTTLTARINTPLTTPDIAATLTATGLQAGGMAGTVTLTAQGTPAALDLRLRIGQEHSANVSRPTVTDGDGIEASARATLSLPRSSLRLIETDAAWHGETVHLKAPATVTFADGLAIDSLGLDIAAAGRKGAVLTLGGRVLPVLALQVSARDITPDLLRPFQPDLSAAGVVEADATLSGSLEAPRGHVQMTGRELRELNGPARSLAPAMVRLTADLADQALRLQGEATQGANRLTLSGTASPTALALDAEGRIDLATIDPLLLAGGRRLHGILALKAAVSGTPSTPLVNGTALLSDGEFQDYAQGLHLTALTATLAADGQTARITGLSAKAGQGSLHGSGTVGLEAPYAVTLSLSADNAQILASDQIMATVDSRLEISGSPTQGLTVNGTLDIDRAEIHLPEQLPVTVAHITVIRPGQAPPAAAPPALPLTLAIKIQTREVIFVRGHGLDAELTGTLQLGGNLADPAIGGEFALRRGSFSLAGKTLNFTSGAVRFDSGHGFDPALEFIASNTSDNVVATISVGGYASKPVITLSSQPDLPQDEIMSYLLFSSSTTQQSPLQLATIASALASLGGVGGGGGSPLDTARQAIGLDRLSVGSSHKSGSTGSAASSPTLEGGSYVADGIYVGAKQGTAVGDTTAQVRIDITNRLKIETEISSGKNSSNLGLTYQLPY